MEISKLKLEIYDFLGVIIPGLLILAEGMILLRGWPDFVASVGHVGGIGLTFLVLLAFGIGNLVQELGHITIRTIQKARRTQTGRERYWKTKEGDLVKEAIKNESAFEIDLADTAYDYCLTRIKNRFQKRDLFVAISDMCRSFVVLSVLGLAPSVRVTFHDLHSIGMFLALFFLLLVIAILSWNRMVRFRELSESTVFRVYLAVQFEDSEARKQLEAKPNDSNSSVRE